MCIKLSMIPTHLSHKQTHLIIPNQMRAMHVQMKQIFKQKLKQTEVPWIRTQDL